MAIPVEPHLTAKTLAWAEALAKRALAYGKRYATLEARVEALEAALAKQPPDACPKCGERAMRLHYTWGLQGRSPNQYRRDDWKCEKCGHLEQRLVHFKA